MEGRMTIKDIKEWREQGGVTGLEKYGLIMVDTLLAEVERLNDCKGCDAPRQLAIATEALNQIANHFSELPLDQRIAMIMRGKGRIEDAYQYIASTALERMNG